jgi:hypothetical protein
MSVVSFLPNPILQDSDIDGYSFFDLNLWGPTYSALNTPVDLLNTLINDYCYQNQINTTYMIAQLQTSYELFTSSAEQNVDIEAVAIKVKRLYDADIKGIRLLDNTTEPERYIEVKSRNKATYVVYSMNETMHDVFMFRCNYDKMF